MNINLLPPPYFAFVKHFYKLKRIFFIELGELGEYDKNIIKAYCGNETEIYCGSTRFCIIDKNYDSILKCNYSFEYEGEISDINLNPYYLYPFLINYCQAEIQFRTKILQEYPLLSPLFLPLKQIESLPIYIQEKIILYEEKNIDIYQDLTKDKKFFQALKNTKQYKNKIITNRMSNINMDLLIKTFNYTIYWYYDVYKKYGEYILASLLAAKEKYKIQDLNSFNLGYNKDGKPVIFDYIGSQDEYNYSS